MEITARKRANPEDDVLSLLATVSDEQGPLNELELTLDMTRRLTLTLEAVAQEVSESRAFAPALPEDDEPTLH